MSKEQVARIIASMKGLAGSGNILSDAVSKIEGLVAAMDPGDFVRSETNTAVAAPVSHDLWYLFYHDNLLRKYHADETADFKHYKYDTDLSTIYGFLNTLTGLKPLKVLTDLKEQLVVEQGFGEIIPSQYENNGIYWINTIAFELWGKGRGAQYASDGTKTFKANDYVGYLSFPIGQMGTMEVISLLQETDLSGYKFAAVDSNNDYWPKVATVMRREDSTPAGAVEIDDKYKPTIKTPPEMFPDAKDSNGNALAGQNNCYGRHLVESGYLVPSSPAKSQNAINSNGTTAYAPTPSMDVELFSSHMEKYPENVKPKKWMRYWIHKDSTLPVPGEFIGILCRPVATPPHVWWFQESAPFVYAGNWMETGHLTSGIVTEVTAETERTDGKAGNQYKVKIQGCEVMVDSSDFLSYSVGDRVAILKIDTTETAATKSFTWLDQAHLKAADSGKTKANYVIIPATFYKKKT
jgi:hypothetical protein